MQRMDKIQLDLNSLCILPKHAENRSPGKRYRNNCHIRALFNIYNKYICRIMLVAIQSLYNLFSLLPVVYQSSNFIGV